MPFIDHFGMLAPHYDRMMREKSPESIIRTASLPVAGKLLDAGGGTGRISEGLQGLVGERVIADFSLDMARQAASKPGLLALCAASEGLPFPDGTFERVIMVDALHHVLDARKTAQELWRILPQPGGRIVIEEPDIRSLPARLIALAEKLLLMRSHFISPPRIQALFDDPLAQARIETESYNAWVIIDKPFERKIGMDPGVMAAVIHTKIFLGCNQ